MKNEPTQSQDSQPNNPLPLIKLLSLATVTWGVLGHGWLNMLGGGWVIWVLLGLLLLLEAGGADSRPAGWSHGLSMFGRILGPAMLPFYGALGLLLAVGPSYIRQTPVFTLPPKGSSQPNRVAEAPGFPPSFNPNASSAPKPGSLPGSMNAPSMSSSPPRPFKRPNIPQPPPTAGAKFQPPSPPTSATAPSIPKPVPSQMPTVSPTPAPSAATTSGKPTPIQPSGSARPQPAATK